jgi:hypothetical protein
MADYGHELEFRYFLVPDAANAQVGISLIPDTDSLERSRELVRVADDGGVALVGIQDHPYRTTSSTRGR